MIEFKTVCKNFAILFENAKSSPTPLFLNSSLEIVRNAEQKASFEEVISALQSRNWKVSGETKEEIDENIKKIWQQTIYIYQDSPSCNLQCIQDLYKSSVVEGLLINSSTIEEYAAKVREQCEFLCIQRCLYESKKILSNPIEDLMQPLLDTFEEEVEKKYQEILALQSSDEFELLKDWSQNHIEQFLSVFIEEENGTIKESFPKLFKLFLLTQDASVSKRKVKRSTHSQKKNTKKPQREMTPAILREKLLKTIKQAFPVETSSLDKIKFLSLKNAMNPKNINFRQFWTVLKNIHLTYDKIESDKVNFLKSEEGFFQNSKKLLKKVEKLQHSEHLRPQLQKLMESFKQAEEKQKKDRKERSLAHFHIKKRMKTHFLENGLPSSKLFTEIILIKMKNSSFFDQSIESSFLKHYIKSLPKAPERIENDEAIYRNLLQELEKIQSKSPVLKDKNLYKFSKETQDFFEMIGEDRDQIFSLEQFKELEIPILQPIFNKKEIEGIKEFLLEIKKEEDFFWETMMESLLEHKLELQEEAQKAELPIPKREQRGKKGKALQQKRAVHQETTTAIHVTSKNWQQIIPIQTQHKVNLLYPTHVTRWFDDPVSSLKDPKYTAIIRDIGKEECVYFHSFPKIIDEFVGSEYSLQNEVYNQRTKQSDILYGIPGEFEIKGKKYRGFFQYVIDSKSGTCYHRCFNFRSKNFIEDLVEERIWYPNDFPTLDQSKNYIGQKIESFVFEGITLEYDSILQKIYIRNDDMKIVLFNNFDSALIDELYKLLDK